MRKISHSFALGLATLKSCRNWITSKVPARSFSISFAMTYLTSAMHSEIVLGYSKSPLVDECIHLSLLAKTTLNLPLRAVISKSKLFS